jgi:glycine hydroxymethyltransferase
MSCHAFSGDVGACERFVEAFALDSAVLYAGTNLVNPALQRVDVSNLGMMPVIGAGQLKQQPNVAPIARLERSVESQLLRIYGGAFADARPFSCSIANLAVFTAFLTHFDDVVLALPGSCGGHPSQNEDGILGRLRARILPIPYDAARQAVDERRTVDLIASARPRLVAIGQSTVIRASDLEQIAAAAHKVGALVMFDASHVAGLIAGGEFPNPLHLGADLLTASTYKTLACPPAAFVIGASKALEEPLRNAISPTLLSNYDAGRLLKLRIALNDVADFHAAYSTAVLDNTDAMRNALAACGFAVVTPTDRRFGTHQILLEAGSRTRALEAVSKLQSARISTSLARVPGVSRRWALRLGTQLLTRRGMCAEQMRSLSQVICNVLRGQSIVKARRAVSSLCSGFRNIAYCHDITPGVF